ncbi:ABC transporter substrate-binding protein [Halosimplex pelagicum]|uniref:ABC transporter substrate-binding protein n=1 Tax=Halosimplex pelagicum TaxID=869886 RepID=A0A7D5PE30_9EURY|nr:ABC transporter substrate-binding protein [Halosimplex pelagicum]QLH81680.1 ABC transporter substrate-binding protein [Halosimplex pelagicum]
MAKDVDEPAEPTRRDYLTYGGTIVGGGLIAGCSGDSGSDGGDGSTDAGATDAGTPTPTPEPNTPTATPTETATPESESYSVTMAPAGAVEFDSVPETWMAYYSTYGDMGLALGQLDGLQALVYRDSWTTQFYDALPGVDVSLDGVQQLFKSGFGKEALYEIDADAYLVDSEFASLKHDSITTEDFDEVAGNVGPVIGNYIRRSGGDWREYPTYSLYEAFEKIAEVFQERERYEAIEAVHDEFVADLEEDLPPAGERPQIGLVSAYSDFPNGSLDAYPIGDGNGKKQYQDLGVGDGFGEYIDGSYASWDYEQLLEADPEILVFPYAYELSASEFEERIDGLRSHPVGERLTAVENGRLYRGGTSYQGPILNLLQTEVAAKQFYPEQFGEWNGLETLQDEDAQLFDHQRVADVINGEF